MHFGFGLGLKKAGFRTMVGPLKKAGFHANSSWEKLEKKVASIIFIISTPNPHGRREWFESYDASNAVDCLQLKSCNTISSSIILAPRTHTARTLVLFCRQGKRSFRPLQRFRFCGKGASQGSFQSNSRCGIRYGFYLDVVLSSDRTLPGAPIL